MSKQFGQGSAQLMQIRRLESILNEFVPANTPIDYMNVDCEGLDHDVIISNDWSKFRPTVLSAEIHGLNLDEPLANKTVRFLRDNGYRMLAHYYVTAFFEKEA